MLPDAAPGPASKRPHLVPVASISETRTKEDEVQGQWGGCGMGMHGERERERETVVEVAHEPRQDWLHHIAQHNSTQGVQ